MALHTCDKIRAVDGVVTNSTFDESSGEVVAPPTYDATMSDPVYHPSSSNTATQIFLTTNLHAAPPSINLIFSGGPESHQAVGVHDNVHVDT